MTYTSPPALTVRLTTGRIGALTRSAPCLICEEPQGRRVAEYRHLEAVMFDLVQPARTAGRLPTIPPETLRRRAILTRQARPMLLAT